MTPTKTTKTTKTTTQTETPTQTPGRAAPALVSTPWGPATVVEQATVPQRAGDRRFTSAVQLLSDPRGELLVRFAYGTGGVTRRGPVTLRARDLERLRAAVAAKPGLAAALGWSVDGAGPVA